ncbi:hypothetical protein H0H87_002074 [Tephrocybe sp. NHM501043]|nr:hypothetical protein H0H87_002074 [Tephrocybe sp. NHM501043]
MDKRHLTVITSYEILNDPQTRGIYDERGIDGLKGPGGGGGPNFDPSDIFAQFFQGGGMFFDPAGAGAGPGRRGGGPEVIPHEVTLEDLYNGKSVKMNMEREALCGQCQGSGAKGNAKPKACVDCEGKGFKIVHTQVRVLAFINKHGYHKWNPLVDITKPDRVFKSYVQWLSRKRPEVERERQKCKGEKTVTEKKRQEIFIEKGMTNGQRIVLPGAGDEQPGVPAGDVVFVLKAAPHETFERSGNDLLTHVKITLSEALFGFSRILITHMDGRGIEVSSPPGKVLQSENTIVLRGEGMPTYKHPDEKGDLYVIFSVEMPDDEWLKTVDKKALESLLPPKRSNPEPLPEIVTEAEFEESDIMDVRFRSFPADQAFFDEFSPQFGGDNEDDWSDEDEDDGDYEHGPQPECHPQ